MTSLQATARGPTGTVFQDIKAEIGDISRAALNRSLFWLLVRFLPLVFLTCWSVNTAHANGVNSTLGSGQLITGTVTTTGVDTYTFQVNSAGSIHFTDGVTATPAWDLVVKIYDPSGTNIVSCSSGYNCSNHIAVTTTGTYTAKVTVWSNGAGGA